MSTILCFSVNMGCCVYINEEKKMNLNDFSKWLQYNKEWKIKGGLNTFRTHCIWFINIILNIMLFFQTSRVVLLLWRNVH